MNPSVFVLLSCLSCGFLVGCATAPTATQEAVTASGVRLATVAYITRGKTPAEQTKRATQILDVTALVRAYAHENGDVVVSLDAAAAVANDRIVNSDLAPNDRALAQAIVIEAMMLAGEQQVVPHPSIGAENAARLLTILGEIERVAQVFGTQAV